MRVLFTPMTWPTHYYQMVGLAWALRASGHEVRVAGQPSLADAVTGTGITAVQVGGDYDVVAGISELVRLRQALAKEHNVTGPGQFPPDVFAKILELRMLPHIRTAEDMADDLVRFAERWQPDLVITDPVVYAAPLAAAAARAPLVRHLWGPDMCRHIGLPGSGVSEAEDHRAAWPEDMVKIYARYGVTPRPDIAARTLDTCPASLQLDGVPNRVAMRYTSYNGSAVAPSWLLDAAARPRVCVTWGSAATELLGPDTFLVPRILEALSGLDVEVVVAIRSADRAKLGQVPEAVRVVESMPLELILPTCQAIVHQSGAGTTLTAALYGVPQLTLPQVADQDVVSAQLAGTGAGIGLKAAEADPEAIRAAVDEVLFTEAPRAAAARLQEEIAAQPPPAAIVRTLEELA